MISSDLSFSLFVNSTLVLAVLLVIDRMMSNASAAVRHRWLVAGFLSLLVLPVFTLVAPTWRLPVLPANWNTPQADIQLRTVDRDSRTPSSVAESDPNGSEVAPIDNLLAETSNEADQQPATSTFEEPIGTAHSHPHREHQQHASISEPIIAQSAPLRDGKYSLFAAYVWRIWFLGALIATVPLIVGICRVNTICRKCVQITDGQTLQVTMEVRDQLSVRGSVRVLEAPESLVPMVWGLVRTAVIVPKAHRAWSKETCRLVMVHELAHVKRCDIFYQLIARITCSFYWFHPLAWYALRRLRVEREQACDDCVLTVCNQPTNYAWHLLEIAKSHRAIALLPAVTMAQRSCLERRIRAMLDGKRAHLPLNPRLGRALLLGSIAIAALCSGLRLEPFASALGIPDGEAQPPTATDQGKSNKDWIKITGRVVSPKNEPIAGAKLILREMTRVTNRKVRPDTQRKTIAQTTTDSHGIYSMDIPAHVGILSKSDKIDKNYAHLTVWAPGYEPMGHNYFKGSFNFDIVLSPSSAPLAGRIVNSEGQPIPGVQVRVLSIADISPPVSKWVDEARRNPAQESRGTGTHYFHIPTRNSFEIVSLAESDSETHQLFETLTDNDGRFRIENIGDDRLVNLLIQSPLVRSVCLQAITRKMEPANAPVDEMQLPTGKYFGNDFVYEAEPAQIVRGTARDRSSGKPIEGAQIHLYRHGTWGRVDEDFITATTDRDGRYELQGISKADGDKHRLSVYGPSNEPHFRSYHDVPHQEGLGPIELDIEITRGIWIEGVVTDAVTGNAVRSSVHYLPFKTNPITQVHEASSWEGIPLMYRTDAQGRFRVPGMAGKGILRTVADVMLDYQYDFPRVKLWEHMREMNEKVLGNLIEPGSAMVELDIAQDIAIVTKNVQLTPRKGIEIHVVDPDGKDVVDYHVAGQFADSHSVEMMSSIRYWQRPPEPRSTFSVFDNDVQTPRDSIIVFQKATGLGAVVQYEALQNADNGVRKLTLQPGAKIVGRILRRDANSETNGALESFLRQPRSTDIAEFDYRVDYLSLRYSGAFNFVVPPGGKYWVRYRTFPTTGSQTMPLDILIMSGLEVGPGERIDLGEIDIAANPQSWPKPIRSKQAPRQVVKGSIVDPDGNPIRRVHVRGIVKHKSWETLQEDHFQIDDYQADEPRNLYFYEPFADFVGHLRLEGNTPGTPVVKLGKSTSLQGRVVDAQGEPIPGVEIVGEGVPFDFRYGYITDENGRFNIRGLIPGRKYDLIGELTIREQRTTRPLATVQVQATTPQDLGDIVWQR